MAEWRLLRIGADYDYLSKKFGHDPLVMRIIRNRGYESEAEINDFLYGDEDAFDLTAGFAGMEESVTLLKEIKEAGKKIRVIGDYDIDGICATAILVKGLRAFGLQVDYAIPHRLEDGYGLSTSLIERAKEDGIEAVITCDNGIAAHEAISLAKDYGMAVCVTDHHEIMKDAEDVKKENLPSADAVVNPKRSENRLEFREFCGAMVAYKVVSRLLCFRENKEHSLRNELLMLAAFATVGDIMPLQNENRALVKAGLRLLSIQPACGMRCLMEENDLLGKEMKAYHVGFVLGPCLNATGRLDTAERALELLLTNDCDRAREIAISLKRMNEVRKELTAQGEETAIRMIEERDYSQDKVLVIYLPDTHESVAGIIAGRLKERFYKPAIVFTAAKDGIKGSGRSVPEYDMYENLWVTRDLFTKFGGHKMAAGISMPEDNLETLRLRLNEAVKEKTFEQIISIDADMPFGYVSETLLADLDCLEPYGSGNARPVFAQREVTFLSEQRFGTDGKYASFRVQDLNGNKVVLKFFGDVEALHRYVEEKHGASAMTDFYAGTPFSLSVIYQPELNTFRGVTSVQFRLTQYK
ncbi:MAG: single-stranded-DNA-specific exonuclease RecJ [Lachnospiraceae bacterium]|nr:single-stranded-DNA-specific exonuclease RecJ [Lachnospiraceae bacterium]